MSRRQRRAVANTKLKMIHNRLEDAEKTVKPHRGLGVTVTNRKLAIMVNSRVFHYERGLIYYLFRAPLGLGLTLLIATILLPLSIAYAIAYVPFRIWERFK